MTPRTPRSDIDYELLMKIQKGTMAYSYRGIPLQKNPFDLAIYSMLLERTRPRTLIEIGSYMGGSTLWFADQASLLGIDLRVLSIDLEVPTSADGPSVKFLRGDARELRKVLPPSVMEELARPLMVVEDSSHHAGTTAAVLEFFDSQLRSGEYIVIEDGILSDMRVADAHYDGGPLRAIEEFLEKSGSRYEVDRELCDHFGRNVTWNVDGYLRRL
jgi:cephalosporin hydroxylase